MGSLLLSTVLVAASLAGTCLPEQYRLEGRCMPRVWEGTTVRAFYAGWDNLRDGLQQAERAERLARQHDLRVPELEAKLLAFRQFIREDLVAVRLAVFVTAPLQLSRGSLELIVGGSRVRDQGIVLASEKPNRYDRDGLRLSPRASQPAMLAVLLPRKYLGAPISSVCVITRERLEGEP
jgi:hypothetical protein